MIDGVLAATAAELREILAGFEPRRLSGAECAVIVEALAATEKACAAARTAAAAWAIQEGAHKQRGFADGVAWLACHTGTTSGAARQALETMAAMDACPQVQQGLVAGELSLVEAAEIINTDAEVPGSAGELVAVATTSGLRALRDRARDVRLAAEHPEELHARQHRARTFRHWRDRQGMICFAGALAPDIGVAVMNRIEVETDRIRRQARREGSTEPREAHAADALATLLSGARPGRSVRADMVVVCDVNAFRRRHTHPGEACHIIGGGPVPVDVVRQISQDAFLKIAFHDGVDTFKVCHLGRHIPAELRTALELGKPPSFEGAACADCGRRHGLQWDHVDPVKHQGPTSYHNLQARCWADHHEKTERDRQAGLLGPRAP